jgi:hypothetical protein
MIRPHDGMGSRSDRMCAAVQAVAIDLGRQRRVMMVVRPAEASARARRGDDAS